MKTKEELKSDGKEILEALQRGLDREMLTEAERGQVHWIIDDLRQTFFSLFQAQDAS